MYVPATSVARGELTALFSRLYPPYLCSRNFLLAAMDVIPDTDALIAAGKIGRSGTVTTLRVCAAHLDCTLFRSEAATARVIDVDLSSAAGTQSYTTVADFLRRLTDGVQRGLECCGAGDSAEAAHLLARLSSFQCGTAEWTLELHDPLGLSFIDAADAHVRSVARTWEESMEWARCLLPPQMYSDGRQFAVGDDSGVERLVQLLLRATNVVALTGAGVSTESGIVPFRDPREASEERHGIDGVYALLITDC